MMPINVGHLFLERNNFMKYFCVGIKGSGMSTLAQILCDLGNRVSGYDDNKNHTFTEEGLIKRNIKIFYEVGHPIDKDTIVTYSKAFSLEHPELVYLKSLGLKFISYNELLGDLTRKFQTICVCGTHGKTTTSTMISDILKTNIGTNYFIGDGSGYADPKNKLFVIESCEFQRHFLSYHPYIGVVTNIELEHTECYKDINDIIKTFNIFLDKASLVVACGDDTNIRKLNLKSKVYYYGLGTSNDLYAINIKMNEEGSSFDCYYHKKFIGRFRIPLTGIHMILDSLASIMIGILYEEDVLNIKNVLKNFTTPKRRFKETKVGSNILIDDYAHHPTEIEKTIEAARLKYPDKRIVAIFKPNTYSRTKDLKEWFKEALRKADDIYVTPISCNRERQEDYPGVTSEIIIENLDNAYILDENNIEALLKYENSVLIFMSCANISTLEEKYKKEKLLNFDK